MLLAAGRELNLGRWVLEDEFVQEYLNAVAGSSAIYTELGAVPPMALVARAIGVLLQELSLPPGTIHASQEMDFRRMVNLGEEVSCIARLSRAIRRGDWQLISADFTMYGTDGEALLSGKSTFLVPTDGVPGE